MSAKTIVTIRDEEIKVRKKQPPPAKILRDQTAYRRKPKHRRHDDARHDEAPGRENPPGAFVSGSGRALSRPGAAR